MKFIKNIYRILLIAVLVSAVFAQIKADDIDITIPVDPLFQTDYHTELGHTGQNIDKIGCSLTAWTMAINYALKNEKLHNKNGEVFSYTPVEINNLLNQYRATQFTYKKDTNGNYPLDGQGKYIVESKKEIDGWGDVINPDDTVSAIGGDLDIGALRAVIAKDTKARSSEGKGLTMPMLIADGFGKKVPIPVMPPEGMLASAVPYVLEQLNKGIPVMVRVANNSHSVLVTSYHGPADGSGRFDIKDPIKNGDSSILWLDDPLYGNKIYHFAAGVFQKGGIQQPYEVPNDIYLPDEILFNLEYNPDQFGPQSFVENTALVAVPEPSQVGSMIGFAIVGMCCFRKARSSRDAR